MSKREKKLGHSASQKALSHKASPHKADRKSAAPSAAAMLTPDFGLSATARDNVSKALSRALAETYTLYTMTQNFHWNVEGPYFFTLHTMFEQQYTDFALAVDALAERIRTLGATAPGTFEEFAKLSKVRQVAAPLSAKLMVATLLDANQTVTGTLREVATLATEAGDEETNGLAVDRMQIHEKFAWMLRATLAGE